MKFLTKSLILITVLTSIITIAAKADQIQSQQITMNCPEGTSPAIFTEVARNSQGEIVWTRNQSYCKPNQTQQAGMNCPEGTSPANFTEVARNAEGEVVWTRNQSYCKAN